ncbi:hypothetical protein J6590_024006 [Homalodisca vitripennis]|nr:hypothetical protein J6590_024006 [Homalodisca vitripennis]
MMDSVHSLEQEQEWEEGKVLIRRLAQTDGTLISPIDLTLDITTPLSLEKLRWLNFDLEPTKLKVTNTGETAIVSGKWNQIRPYLNRGPLDANYVFSQLHFHWGKDEHEGSEHTAGGIKYPLEMHVVFYKTGYLTQPAALKHDDGIVTVVYLIKLQDKSTPGLQLLTAHLDKVTEPYTSVLLPLVPLSCLLVPFTKDYFLYWGSLATSRCSHKVLWFVSRAALGITTEDLDKFRSMLNSGREKLNRNFRITNEAQGRTVFHVSPSVDRKHLLHQGTVEPPGKTIITFVNYSQIPNLDSVVAERVFSKGDCIGDTSSKMSKSNQNLSNKSEKCKPYIFPDGVSRRCSIQFLTANSTDTSKRRRRSSSVVSSSVKSSDSNSSRYSPNWAIAEEMRRSKSQKRSEAASRKVLETERKLEQQKLKLELLKKQEEALTQECRTLELAAETNRGYKSPRGNQPYTIRKRTERVGYVEMPTIPPEKVGSRTSYVPHFAYRDKNNGLVEKEEAELTEKNLLHGENITDNCSTAEKFNKLIMVVERGLDGDAQNGKGINMKPALKSRLPVPVSTNTVRKLDQPSLEDYYSNLAQPRACDLKPKTELIKRQRMETFRTMKKPLSQRPNQGVLGKTTPRLVTTIPKPLTMYSGKPCEKVTKPYNMEEVPVEPLPIPKTSSKMLCELCFC